MGKAGQLIGKFLYTIEKKITELKISLRYKLLVMFFLIALLSLVFTLFAFSLVKNTISSQIDGYQKAIVTSSQKIVEHYVLNCQRSLMALGGEKNFRRAVKDRNKTVITNNLKRVFVKHKTFNFVGLVSKTNNKLHMLSSWPGKYSAITGNKKIYSFLKWSFRHPALRNSPVFTVGNRKEIIIVYPLKGALLIGGINLDNLFQLLGKIKPMKESNFILLDSEKKIILGGEGEFDYKFESEEGSIEFSDRKILAYYTYNKVIGWWIILSSPTRVIYSSLIRLKRLVMIFIVLGIVIAFLIALYFSKRVTLPIAHLNEGARILGGGNLNYRINLKTGDELEVLADEFNMMGEKLKKSYDSMGEKIKNATRDLEDAYKEIGQKNEELQETDKLKSEFLASMSHELRTPINAIIGFTSLMEDGTYGKISKKQKDTLRKIIHNTQHLLNLINDILDLSKIEAGRMELNPEKIKLNLLLSELAAEVKPLVDEKGLDFVLETDEDIECYYDYTRLKQVVMNLVSNAIKFTNEGEVKIKAKTKEDNIFVEVQDTGIGIRENQLAHIFDEFVQADGSITREFGGTGLGLGISKKLVEMMKGKIKVESEWEKGSTFTIVLPYESKQNYSLQRPVGGDDGKLKVDSS